MKNFDEARLRALAIIIAEPGRSFEEVRDDLKQWAVARGYGNDAGMEPLHFAGYAISSLSYDGYIHFDGSGGGLYPVQKNFPGRHMLNSPACDSDDLMKCLREGDRENSPKESS